MKTYIIYDGRAAYDIDAASVIECFEARDDVAAKKYLKRHYKGFDYVLATEDGVLI